MEQYANTIIEMIQEIRDEEVLKRIYNLVSYLYIHFQENTQPIT